MPFVRFASIARALVLLALAGLVGVSAVPLAAAPAVAPRGFETPQAAADALFEAAKARDRKAVVAILGPAVRDWIVSGDPVQDQARVARFVDAYAKKSAIVPEGGARAVLTVGDDGFPFPFPLVKTGTRWRFDPEAGREEVLNRTIGRNELAAIQTLLAVVDAQRDYAARLHQEGGAAAYARRFRSSPGKKDGLFWPAAQGEPESPLGPLVADAVREGYRAKGGPVPFHGYHFRMLTAQGPKAPGGAYDYLAGGRLIGGFAALAWPARYGISGIKTFAVNHEGVVYEADLGPDTGRIAPRIDAFDPDARWTKVEPPKR
ncbi:DUF2950 domain-containing protein [Rhodoplanes sp. TEM]|uniref:DUF2950 domain-containing protein n=1 Tax=Rhodoplanes tepidamans TaxID=200616 RepID=A0ABT5JBT2_RHOTP|nr:MULTISPECIES: DUF2950 domain-containing protein [Rhodoplanes]MDC7787135.1 DUF2950 domain-containing protein [Rhodoplanes tepidamans]MDC7984301.1 DUF2950 domain-containing protein [Rhodoplanes sp. TEM]MDQ0356098.1 hypothetical protein [Rhodoplanes tepidamans]